MVIVNTVVIVRGILGRPENDVALALGAFGGGSMLAALLLPRVLDRLHDRGVMLPAAGWLGAVLWGLAAFLFWRSPISSATWPILLTTWTLLGVGYSAAQTPTGRLLKRSANAVDRPTVFAAQVALSHAAWLVTYPLAGWLGARAGMPVTLAVLGCITFTGVALAARLWPADDGAVEHDHPELPADHPHRQGYGSPHRHEVVIDELHQTWPFVRP